MPSRRSVLSPIRSVSPPMTWTRSPSRSVNRAGCPILATQTAAPNAMINPRKPSSGRSKNDRPFAYFFFGGSSDFTASSVFFTCS